jgi:GNAT superfamily N-acetyltransferase
MNNHLPTSGVVIRPASFSDIPFIRDLAYRTWPTSYRDLLGSKQMEYMLDLFYSQASLEKQMQEHHYFYLALLQYQPVGFASFSSTGKDIYKLQKLYVLPAEQKSGVGKTLLEMVETVSKSMGAKRLSLNVNRKNAAKDFYERNGFAVLKEEDVDIGKGYFMNDYVMEKIL